METRNSSFATLSDHDLLATAKRLAGSERHATPQLIASLAELDARRLYLGEGCSSLFTYCTQVLHLTEHAAYGRIEAARAARRFPELLDRLADGSITLTAVGLLASHLTPDNHCEVLDAARHRSKRDVESLVTDAPQASRPIAAGSRHIPAAIRRAVWARDEGRCAFVGTMGRCTERGFLEFHHDIPYAAGGEATVDTIALRCRAHNLHEAEQDFGPRASAREERTRSGRAGHPPQPSLLRERSEPFGEAPTRSGPSWCIGGP